MTAGKALKYSADKILGMAEQNFVCPFCGTGYETKEGLAKHLKKCDAKPDVEEHEDDIVGQGEGIPLFNTGEDENDNENVYCCPDCDYQAGKPFNECPKCGCEVDFS